MEFDLSLLANMAIGGVAVVPIIIGLIALAKRMNWLGENNQYAPYAAGVLAVVAYGSVELLKVYPAFVTYAAPVASATYIFLVVSGVYQLAKSNKA